PVAVSDLDLYLNMLFGSEPEGGFVELRWRHPGGGMGREFHPVKDRTPTRATIRALGERTDLYIGAAPRTRRAGGREAVKRAHVVWVDLDSPEALEKLASFCPEPSLEVGSGRGQHAYWSLWPPVGPDALERANRRLCAALDGDPHSVDAARILRPP